MNPLFRIGAALLALLLGGAIVYTLTYAGEKSQGPMEDIFSGAGEMVRKAEEKMIIEKRSKTRTQQLAWLYAKPGELRNPPAILLGAFEETARESLKPVFELENALHTTFPLVHIYTAWGSKADQKFPKIQVESILKSGSIPVVTWEPWLTDFDPKLFPGGLRPVETRDKNGLSDIAAGLYDSYIRTWAKAAAKVGRPIFLRFGHEMNDPYRYPWGPQNNRPDEFIAAWRHVRHIFLQENAGNVVWVWSPHPAYGYFEAYFPGGEYVDWVGVGVLNYGIVAPWSQWWTFDEIFGKHYDALAVFQKPIMISEFGSLAVGGNRAQWYTDALSILPKRYPMVKALLFFHFSNDQTTTHQSLDWTIKNDAPVLTAVIKAVKTWN